MIETGALQKIPEKGTASAKEMADAVGVDESVISWLPTVRCFEWSAD
jgi:hypothetical protein